MSKNMTRKGLAFGAGLALIGSGIVALPAQAAVAITLEPFAGTEYTMIAGEAFTLRAFGNVEFPSSNAGTLRVKVTNKTASGSFDSFAINGTALDNDYGATGDGNGNMILFTGGTAPATGASVTAGNGTLAAVGSTVDATAVMGLGAAAANATAADSVSVMTTPFTFSFNNSTVSAGTPENLEVVVWADVDNDGVIDAGETKSNTVTVTYVNAADVEPSISISPSMFVGINDYTLSMTLGAVNEAQLTASELGLKIVDGLAAGTNAFDDSTSVGGNTTVYAVTLNTAKTRWSTTTLTADTAIAATGDASKIVATALFKDGGSFAATDRLGAASFVKTFTASTTTIDATNTVAELVTGANAAGTDVRRNSEFVARLKVRNSASPAAALAGVGTAAAVSTSVTLSTTKTLTVNGVTYNDSEKLADLEITGTTDANGYHAVTILPTGFSAADTVTVTWTTQGQSDSVTATQRTTAFTTTFAEGLKAADTGYNKTIVVGGSQEVTLAVADQFGVAPADGTYSVTLTRAASGAARTTAAAWALNVPVVGGVAKATIKDNGTGAGADTVTATLVGASASGTDSFTLNYVAAATSATVTGLTFTDNQVAADSKVKLNADALADWHYFATAGKTEPVAAATNFDNNSTTNTTTDTLLTLTGAATLASGAGVEGAPVTITANGLVFEYVDATSGEIYKRNSITVPTAADGSFTVYAYSDGMGGDVTVTASAGGVTKTTVIRFDGNTTVGSFEVSVPASALPGRTVDVIVTAKDSFGTLISGAAVTLSSTGPGYLINTSGTTLSDGTFGTKLLLGANDSGVAVVKVTMTVAGVSTTKTAEIKVGAAAGKVNVGSFNGKLVVYASGLNGARISWKVGGVWGVGTATSNYSIFNRPTPRAGVTVTVDIYVNGVKTLTKSVLTR